MKKKILKSGCLLSFVILTIITGISHGKESVETTNSDKPIKIRDEDVVNGSVFYGTETNGIKLGLWVSSNNICTPIIRNSIRRGDSFGTILVWFPPDESCYQMTLKDEKGNEVEKTDKGKKLGKPLTAPLHGRTGPNFRAGYKAGGIFLDSLNLINWFPFNPQDYFKITNSGKYTLTYEMKIVWSSENKEAPYHIPVSKASKTKPPPTLTLPPVVTEVEIKLPTNSSVK